jgi:hypothetical protein
MQVLHGTGAVAVRFGIYGEDQNWIGNFVVMVDNPNNSGVPAMIAQAHRQMSDVLRQWLFRTDMMRQAYEPHR